MKQDLVGEFDLGKQKPPITLKVEGKILPLLYRLF
jgi:hypothetical protein